MGCDIHFFVEKKNAEGRWEAVPPIPKKCFPCQGTGQAWEWTAEKTQRFFPFPNGFVKPEQVFASWSDEWKAAKAKLISQIIAAQQTGEPGSGSNLPAIATDGDARKWFCDWCLGVGEELKPYYDGRNYDLFAILADVRNGRGFAGVETGERFNPIDAPRGVPEDASDAYQQAVETWAGDGHSHSYFTVAELFAYDWQQKNRLCGVVDYFQYLIYLQKGKPERYSGDVWGRDIVHVTNDEMNALVKKYRMKDEEQLPENLSCTYTKVWWMETYADSCADFLNDTLPALQQLGDPNDVRIVFFFDN